MKVALVCDWYHPRVGGIELHLQNLATHLVGAGHEVVVITPTPGDPIVDGIRVRRIDAPLAPVFGFLTTPGGVRAIGDVLAEERVDVAHCHVSIVSPAALGGAHEAQRRSIPTALTFHSVVPQTHLLARAVDLMFGTSRWRARFSAVSERVAADVQAVAGGREMTVIPNGIDVGFWRVSPIPHGGGDIRLVSVMRLNPKKRPLALVDMMRSLVSTFGDAPRVSLRIVGDGPQRSALAAAIARAGLGGRIELLGRRSRDEIRTILAESDVFVLPTVRESFGLAALEARCVGLPVVAMAASGVAELIRHRREGLLARSDSELAAHVATLVRDAELRETIARHNRNTVPPYDWPRVIEQHLALYREAIALRSSV
jgi:glycosyltransferase involved in cell wall biosynthesis